MAILKNVPLAEVKENKIFRQEYQKKYVQRYFKFFTGSQYYKKNASDGIPSKADFVKD